MRSAYFISGAQPYQVFADVINQELAVLNNPPASESTPEASGTTG